MYKEWRKVEGHTSLVRESFSSAVINTDKTAYKNFMQRVKEAKQSNDDLRGEAGNDTISSGSGSDTMIGFNGNESFNIRSKSGAYADTVNGGAGTDTLDIDYTGISNLGSFAITYDSGTVTLTDSNGGSITYPIGSMENLTVNSIAYSKVGGGNAYWNSTEKVVYANQPISLSSSDITGLSGLSASDNLT